MHNGDRQSHAEQLRSRIADREARIGVIGLGYVGLPLAVAFAEQGFPVLGFDVDPAKVEALGRGDSYISHFPREQVAAVVKAGKLAATGDFARLGEPDALLICVPTPLTPQREPDLSYVETTVRQIGQCLRPGQLVVLESTTYPGTTDELVAGLLAADGRTSGEDYFLAFSPEREDPGNPVFNTTRIPKVVGGVDPVSGELARDLYEHIVPQTVLVSSARTAEATKLMENIFRSVNIALVNELKVIYGRMGIDIWEVLDAAATKPFGFMRFNPGPGWGGHCIPLDPFYLSWKAREFGLTTRFIELAGEVNVRMHEYVVERLTLALNDRAKPVKGSKVLVLGVAYKKDVADTRESPAFHLIDALVRLGAEVSFHDPFVPVLPVLREWPEMEGRESAPLDAATLRASDAVVLVTDHSSLDYGLILEHAPLIVDTRGIYRNKNGKMDDKVVRA
jgi:UDP-N-acetyl-D-glucosamine dehydrogenase